MKKYLYIVFVGVLLLSSALTAVAQSNNPCDPSLGGGNLGYCPLEPIQNFTVGTANADLPTLLKGLFRILFSLSALLAVGRLVVGGIMYMTSDVAGNKTQAKKWATSALYGLLILAGSYLILYTINPDLVRLNLTIPKTHRYTPAILPTTQNQGGNTTGTGSTPSAPWKCTGFGPKFGGVDYYPNGAGASLNGSGTLKALQDCQNECFNRGGKVMQTANGTDAVGEYFSYKCIGAK